MTHFDQGPVIVTGGSRGIGAATVKALAWAGRPVAFSYVTDDQAAEKVCEGVTEAGGKCVAFKGDVTDPAAVDGLFALCRERLGPPTGLFANAGITGPAGRLENLDVADLRRVLDINVVGSFLAAKAAIREMTGGVAEGGAIVLMSSRAAQLGGAGEWLHYAASKGAIDSLTIGLANEVGPKGIRVNAVSPGLIDTDIHAPAGGRDRLDKLKSFVPIGRIGTADEVADTVCWLLSSKSAYVSGTILKVSGGR